MEAVSLTCDDMTNVCPGTELTCNCSVPTAGVMWRLPESVTISLDDKVGSNSTTTDGIFYVVVTKIVTDHTGAVSTLESLESMLIYTATESLVNGTIECKELGMRSGSVTINDTFAG